MYQLGKYPQCTLEFIEGLTRNMIIIHNTVSKGKVLIVLNNQSVNPLWGHSYTAPFLISLEKREMERDV